MNGNPRAKLFAQPRGGLVMARRRTTTTRVTVGP